METSRSDEQSGGPVFNPAPAFDPVFDRGHQPAYTPACGDPGFPSAAPSPPSAPRSAGARILVVEQDVPLTKFLGRSLRGEAYLVDVAYDGAAAREAIFRSDYGAVLLDLNLPGLDGLELLEEVRSARPLLPMIVLTARSQDLVRAFENGADDFIVKPFSFVELAARMGSALRRAGRSLPGGRPAGLTVSREDYKVERNGRRIDLTPREFAILECLVRHAGRPVSRAALMEEVWRAPLSPASNIVDVYMEYLRDKIDLDGEEKLVRTVRGVGYALAAG